jgi:ABC-type uncharacterized transport system ATPase subunit
MKYSAFILKCAALVILCGNGALAQAGSETNFVSRISPPALVRSVFVDDPRTGKDPFFPNSVRRREVVETKSSATNAAPTPNALFSQLALKGISGLKDQRLALINSSTVAEGEQADIRAGYQLIKIICREIRDRSVLIEFPGTGEVRELKLRDGI